MNNSIILGYRREAVTRERAGEVAHHEEPYLMSVTFRFYFHFHFPYYVRMYPNVHNLNFVRKIILN